MAGCNALTTNACGQSAWWKRLRGFLRVLSVLGVLRLAHGRLEGPNHRGLWRQTAGCNALTTNACGRSAWWKQRSNNKCLWPECLVEAAATDIKGLKRFDVLRLANGRLERPNNRGLWRQTAGCNALTTEGYGGKRQADRSEGFEAF